MPDLTLPVILWWIGTMIACLLLGMALMAIWTAARRTARVLRVVDVAPGRIARARDAGKAAGRAAVMRDGLAQTNLMMAAVDSWVPGLIGEPLPMKATRSQDLGDLRYLIATDVDDPDAQVLVAGLQQPVVLEPDPGEPFDVEPVEDEPERPGPPPRLDDDDRPAPPLAGETVAPTMTLGPLRRYISPTYNPDGPLEPAGQAVIPKWPAGWVRRSVALFRRRRPDVRAALWVLGLWPPLRHWVVRMLAASVHHARHAARAGAQSWDDSRAELSARWHEERLALTAQLRYALAEQRTYAWRTEVGLIKPPRRTVFPTVPGHGCTP